MRSDADGLITLPCAKLSTNIPAGPRVEWAEEFGVSEGTIRKALQKMNLISRRRPAAATMIDALKVAETYEFSFEPVAFINEHEELRHLACARSDEEAALIL